jgi:hypothetical protein
MEFSDTPGRGLLRIAVTDLPLLKTGGAFFALTDFFAD